MGSSVRLSRRFAADEPATALSSADLSDRTTRGVGWTVFWRFATRGLGLISTLILARLLVPADFGLVALASSFVVAIDALATTGVYDVLIREPGFQPRLYDTAFTIALIRGIVTATALASLAGPAGGFFDEPRLTPILLVLAVGTLIDSAENTGTVDFRKYMRFDREFVLLLLPRILGIMITIAAAVLLQSYWALVIGSLLQKVVRVILGYVLHCRCMVPPRAQRHHDRWTNARSVQSRLVLAQYRNRCPSGDGVCVTSVPGAVLELCRGA